MILSRYITVLSQIDNNNKGIIYSYLNGSALLLESIDIESIMARNLTNIVEKQYLLLENDFIVRNEKEDKAKALYNFKKIQFSNRVGYISLVTTLDCNLNCYYCSQGKIRESIQLNGDVLNSMLVWFEDWIKHNRFDYVNIVVIGGEPLMNMLPVEKIVCLCKNNKVPYRLSVITNGTLIDEKTLVYLKSLGVSSVQITIDESPETHDQIKIIDGRGTFELLLKKIDEIATSGISIDLRVNYETGKGYKVLKAIDRFASLKNKDKIMVYFSTIFHGCTEPDKNDFFDKAESEKLYKATSDLGFRMPNPFNNLICQAETDFGFVIAPDGGVYKCYHDIGNNGSKVGFFTKNELVVENHELLLREHIEECLDCRFFPICHGGCPYEKRLKNISYQNVICHYDEYAMLEKSLLPLYFKSLI